MTGVFYLKCMGLPELHTPDGRVVRMRGRKHLALLIYLVVERRAQYSRDELAHLLWPDTPMPEARHSLATGFSAIRRAMGSSVLVGNRETVRFRQAAVALDLERLEPGELFATPVLPAVEVDAFLQGFEVRDAAEYSHWRDRQHARWLPQVHGALLRLIDHARRTGASRTIGMLADRLLGIDSLSEHGVRAKMEALAFAGDRISALRVYEEWRDRLGSELQAVPSPVVDEMARRLRRRGVERPVGDLVPSVPTDPWRDRPFVGRGVEYRALYEAWESTRERAPRHVLVEGESGIGKSTLVERFAMAAALEGAIVTRVQCYELEQAIPFAAIAALATGLIDKPGVAATDPAALAEVARVVPRVRDRFPGLPAALDSQGETARLHFAEGLLAMLEAAMDEHPVVLVVDDFHLADEVSLTVLHLLMRRMERARMMVLLTLRTTEHLTSTGAARIRDGGDYLRMTRVGLPPLTDAESAELLAALVPPDTEPPTPPERLVLLQASRGVPMVIQLLVQDWRRNGSASLAIAVGSMTEQVRKRQVPEGTYHHILDRVLADLDAPSLLVLRTASILGSRLDDLSLYGLTDLTMSQTMMGMGELTKRHILRDSPSGLDFVNELVRGQAYSQMPVTLRRAIHGIVADALLQRLTAGLETVRGLETAWHLVRGGRAAEAAPHLLRGAREAIREGAPHEAELALGSALGESSILHGSVRAEATILYAQVLQELSMWKRSRETAMLVADEAPQMLKEHAQVIVHVANHRLGAPEEELGHRVFALMALATRTTHFGVRARATVNAALLAEEQQLLEARSTVSELLGSLPLDGASPEEQADVLTARATMHYIAGRHAESIRAVRDAISVLENAKIANSAFANLINGLSALHCANGDYDQAEVAAKDAYRLGMRLDNLHIACKACSNASVAAGRQGKYLDQEYWGRLALTGSVSRDDDTFRRRAALYVGESKAMRGHRDALSVYHEIAGAGASAAHNWQTQAGLLDQADISHILGHHKQALELGRHGTTGENSYALSRGWTGKHARWVTLTALAGNSTDEALAFVRKLADEIDKYDALDRIEIACCLRALSDETSTELEEQLESARRTLAKMPPAVSERLERQGFLRFLG